MKLVSKRDFLRQVTRRSVLLEGREGEGNACLTYSLRTSDNRFWYFPGGLEADTAMCRAVLEASEPWDACWCWRPGRHWEFSPGEDLGDEMQAFLQVRARVAAARIPATFPGALLLGKGERDLVLALMVLVCYTSWNRDEDLYIVPDHCRQLALVCHHDDVHVECPNAEAMCSYVACMRDAGIELPTEMREPGALPEWMKR